MKSTPVGSRKQTRPLALRANAPAVSNEPKRASSCARETTSPAFCCCLSPAAYGASLADGLPVFRRVLEVAFPTSKLASAPLCACRLLRRPPPACPLPPGVRPLGMRFWLGPSLLLCLRAWKASRLVWRFRSVGGSVKPRLSLRTTCPRSCIPILAALPVACLFTVLPVHLPFDGSDSPFPSPIAPSPPQPFSDHRAARAWAGLSRSRGCLIERAATRVREAGFWLFCRMPLHSIGLALSSAAAVAPAAHWALDSLLLPGARTPFLLPAVLRRAAAAQLGAFFGRMFCLTM